LGNFFFCFDGCAQYLTSPTAAYLIASAYQGTESAPVLVACVRKPVEQALSWWKYENNAISWGESIGLIEWNTDLRSQRYPPKSIADAIEFSESEFVKNAYSSAENLVANLIEQQRNQPRSISKLLTGHIKYLPPWAITWPAGQLSTIGRSGHFAQNIKRFNDVFFAAFGNSQGENSWEDLISPSSVESVQTIPNKVTTGQSEKSSCAIGLVHIVPLECQSNGKSLKSVMSPVLSGIVHRRKLPCATTIPVMNEALDKLWTEDNFVATRRNSSTALEKEPSQEDLVILNEYFESDTAWYSSHTKF